MRRKPLLAGWKYRPYTQLHQKPRKNENVSLSGLLFKRTNSRKTTTVAKKGCDVKYIWKIDDKIFYKLFECFLFYFTSTVITSYRLCDKALLPRKCICYALAIGKFFLTLTGKHCSLRYWFQQRAIFYIFS